MYHNIQKHIAFSRLHHAKFKAYIKQVSTILHCKVFFFLALRAFHILFKL